MTRLSNRQYPMLKMFFDGGPNFYMSIDQAQHWDQRPFRSMLLREWVAYRPKHGFHLTKAGRAAWQEFLATDIARKNWSSPLTAAFDPSAYGLAQPKRKAQGRAADAAPKNGIRAAA